MLGNNKKDKMEVDFVDVSLQLCRDPVGAASMHGVEMVCRPLRCAEFEVRSKFKEQSFMLFYPFMFAGQDRLQLIELFDKQWSNDCPSKPQ